MKLVTTKFKSGGLHEKLVVAFPIHIYRKWIVDIKIGIECQLKLTSCLSFSSFPVVLPENTPIYIYIYIYIFNI